MRKITTLIGVLALASMLLAACGGGAVPTVSGEPITVVETVLVTVEVTAEGDVTERKIHVMDGESYTVEIKIADKFRVYQFDNPDSYSKLYDNVI